MGSHEVGYLIGAMVGLVVGILAAVMFLKFIKKDHSWKCKYDERQELVRGRGFKYGFFTMLAYQWGYIVYGEFLEKIAIREVVMTFGIVLGLVVYVSYAVLNEGYFSLNKNPRRVVILFAIIAAGNLLIGLAQIPLGRFFVNGVISFPAVNVMLGLMMLFVLILLFVKRFCKKESEEGQEDE